MSKIEVCIGSSCFLKGAYNILDAFTAMVRQDGLGDKVTVCGAFCKENCRNGVSVEIDGKIYSVPNLDAARKLFDEIKVVNNESDNNK